MCPCWSRSQITIQINHTAQRQGLELRASHENNEQHSNLHCYLPIPVFKLPWQHANNQLPARGEASHLTPQSAMNSTMQMYNQV